MEAFSASSSAAQQQKSSAHFACLHLLCSPFARFSPMDGFWRFGRKRQLFLFIYSISANRRNIVIQLHPPVFCHFTPLASRPLPRQPPEKEQKKEESIIAPSLISPFSCFLAFLFSSTFPFFIPITRRRRRRRNYICFLQVFNASS